MLKTVRLSSYSFFLIGLIPWLDALLLSVELTKYLTTKLTIKIKNDSHLNLIHSKNMRRLKLNEYLKQRCQLM